MSFSRIWIFVAVTALTGACAHHSQDAAKSDTKTAQAEPSAQTKAQSTDAKKLSKKAKKAKAKAEAKSESAAGTIKCTSGKVERTIEVNEKDGGCETIYTKDGEAKSVATSGNGKEYCEQVAAKIQKNLAASGYTCQ